MMRTTRPHIRLWPMLCVTGFLALTGCVPITVSDGGPGKYDNFEKVQVELRSTAPMYEGSVREGELADFFCAELRVNGDFERVGTEVSEHDLLVEVEVFAEIAKSAPNFWECDTYQATVSYVSKNAAGSRIDSGSTSYSLDPENENDEYDIIDFFEDLHEGFDDNNCPTKEAAARIALRELADDFVYIAPYRI